jgi:N-acyl amino acid synthase of PEP-CTERM/exosortase system
MNRNPLAVLDRYFSLEALPPGTPDSALDELYTLRYAVFCEECRFMPPENYPDGRERDGYDPTAAHFCVRNAERQIIGTSRLALVSAGDPFPYEAHCRAFADFVAPDPAESAEISRLAIHASYRRRAGDSLSGVNPADMQGPRQPGAEGADKRINAPLLALGLYRQMYQYSRANGIRYWFAAMEKPLARVLALYGFRFRPIGPEQDYYGPVTPYLGDLRDLEEHLDSVKPDLLQWFQSA